MRLGCSLLSSTLVTLTAVLTAPAQAQTEPPPPPPVAPPPPPVAPAPPPVAPPAVAPAAPGAPAPGVAPAPGAPADPGAAPAPGTPGVGADASAAGSWAMDPNAVDATGSADATAPGAPEAAAPAELDEETAWKLRRLTLSSQNNWRGTTGILRTSSAFSGAPGTFRLSFLTGFFSGSGFLCEGTADSGCDYIGRGGAAKDKVGFVSTDVGLSVSLASFLDAFLGLHAAATSNDQGRPKLLQVMGDTNWGLKAFLPRKPDRIFSVGGELELWLLNGTGSVGLNGSATSFAMRALSSVDLSNRVDPERRVPFAAHFNLGYLFDNSGKIVEAVEANRGGDRVNRIERFGLDIDRVDSLELGLAVEGAFPVVRPFLEWTFDIPVQRQDYICNLSRLDPGEGCLGTDAGFGTTPSRLGLGARFFPGLDGLSVLAAFQIGTGATSKFIEETAPELPWTFNIGLGYAADTKKPQPITKQVEVERVIEAPRPVERVIAGRVIDAKSGEAVPRAIVRYTGRPLTGMVAAEDGSFVTARVDPGAYTFAISAPGYKDGECQVTVPEEAGAAAAPTPTTPDGLTQPGVPGAAEPPPPTPEAGPASSVSVGADGVVRVGAECKLDALPKVGNVIGSAVDAETNRPIPGAKVKIEDRLKRQLELTADASGTFRFENVPPGPVRLYVNAPDYLPSVSEIEVKPREDVRAQLSVNRRPKNANVVVEGREIKLKRQVHFEYDSSKITPDSMSLIQEMADVMKARPELRRIEIQGHTDNAGNAAYNQRLSQERAESVKDALVNLGVDPARLTPKGYGQDKPIAPNTGDANRARNRRVQLIIKEQDKK